MSITNEASDNNDISEPIRAHEKLSTKMSDISVGGHIDYPMPPRNNYSQLLASETAKNSIKNLDSVISKPRPIGETS